MKEKIQTLIKEIIKNKYDLEVNFNVETPRDPSHGDLSSNIAMVLSKELKRNPLEIAEEIKSEILNSKLENIESVEVAKPGFVNFKLSSDTFTDVLSKIIEKKDDFGKVDARVGETWLIEHTSPNPNKAFHLGHWKINAVGCSVVNLVRASGANVHVDCIDNNRGIAIAKQMWGYLKFYNKNNDQSADLNYWFDHQDEWFTPEDLKMPKGEFAGEAYIKGNTDFDSSPEIEEKVRQMVIDWEAEEPKNRALWRMLQNWVWEDYERVIKRIGGWQFEKIWHEDQLYAQGRAHVLHGLDMGIFKKTEDGAIVSDFKKEFGITDTILIKRDGTALYITQDLELTKRKREMFNPDKMVWIIGPEQRLAMQQMFAACSQLGFGKYEDFIHLSYGFISIRNKDGKQEKMSSRLGNTILAEQLIEEAKKMIKPYFNEEKVKELNIDLEETSEKLAIGAVKYTLLNVGRVKDQPFNLETSVSLEGNSGPYIIYAYARAKSVLRQSSINIGTLPTEYKFNESELELIKHLSKFEEAVLNASMSFEHVVIATYVYELAQKFNNFYGKSKILNSEEESMKQMRLALTAATAQVLKNGLGLLGIETVEKM